MIVIPMGGLSRRFSDEGYELPKYMLKLNGKTLFEHSIDSFRHYYKTDNFLFVVRDVFHTPEFVSIHIRDLGIVNSQVVVLQDETKGQAETVALGLEAIDYTEEDELFVFNIDTFRPNFIKPDEYKNWDGYLEVFHGEGANWSYAKPQSEASTKVVETAEKKPISKLCSTGLYYFRTVESFISTFNEMKSNEEEQLKELYIAPLYNYLISKGLDIHYHLINHNEVIFCGTPLEYQNLLAEK